jgi:hypothetical protein
MKELILGQIPEHFDPKKHIPISPVCFIGRENLYPEFEGIEFVDISKSEYDYTALDKLTNDEALSYVNEIAKFYYNEHFKDYSYKFWKAIFYPYLEVVIPFLFRKQLIVEKFIEKYKSERLFVVISAFTSRNRFHFSTLNDFIENGIRNPEFNEYIYSLFIYKLKPGNWQINEIVKDQFISSVELLEPVKKTLRKPVIKIIDKFLFRSHRTYGFSLIDRILFHFLLVLKKPIAKKCNLEEPVFERKINWSIDVYKIIYSCIPDELTEFDVTVPPRKYIKGKLVNYSMNLYRKCRLDSSHAYQNQEIVIAAQHGGHMYGSAKSSESLYNTEFSADYFISWGWTDYKEKKMANIIVLPSPLLSKLYNKHNETSKSVLYIGTAMNLFKERFDSGMTETETLLYRKNKVKFILAFKKHFGTQDLLYKPYSEQPKFLEDSKYISKFVPELKVLRCNSQELHRKISESRYLILDHPGTTLNIAMACNSPLFLFWIKDWFPFNDQSLYFLEEFEKLGIYHNSVESLVKQLLSIQSSKTGFQDWWNQNSIQELRKKWLLSFGLVNKSWRKVWIQTLWNLK